MGELLFGRTTDAPLDARGAREALSLATHLGQEPCVRIETSPRLRARQTAQALAAVSGADVRIRPELDEVDFGRWSGRRFAELAEDADWRRWNERRSRATTPAGDSMLEAQTRIVHRLCELHERREAEPHESYVIVTHAEVIRAALLFALDVSLDDYAAFPIDPASRTRLALEAGRWRVEEVNVVDAALDAA